MRERRRERLGYAVATVVVIGLGLSTRPFRWDYPVVMDAVGDALWAAMVFLGLSVAAPGVAIWKRAAAAVGFSYAIEFSQFYHAPWIDRIRATTLGHLVLGADFDAWDLVKYPAGVAAAVGGVCVWRGRGNSGSRGAA